jgi:probable HAF family extracellular repeat protein
MKTSSLARTVAFAAFLAALAGRAGAQTAVDLGTLGGASAALAFNSNGQVVGYSLVSDAQHPFSWTQARGMIDLGGSSGLHGFALAVNTNGLVVGNTLSGSAYAVNDNGQTVGADGYVYVGSFKQTMSAGPRAVAQLAIDVYRKQ